MKPEPDPRPAGDVLDVDDFLVVRTPLLPLDALVRWSADLAAARAAEGDGPVGEAVEADRARLRAGLEDLLAQPVILEALYVASPSLVEALELWRRAPESKKGARAEQALVRYVTRMGARPTPFGLFSGCSVAPLGDPEVPSALRLGAREDYRRTTRPDTDYLEKLCRALASTAAVRDQLTYRPNSSLYRAAGRLRYAELCFEGGGRAFRRASVEADDYLHQVLDRARDGATVAQLADALVAADPDGEVTVEEARSFVGELIDSQLLEHDLQPLVTGRPALPELVEQLTALEAGAATAAVLGRLHGGLAALDEAGLGTAPETYREIAAPLASMPVEADPARLLQVDLYKPMTANLGRDVRDEMHRGLLLLRRLVGAPPETPLGRFRAAFVERYGDHRPVPLTEVLDEDVGIGFGHEAIGGIDRGPLLEGLPVQPRAAGAASMPWGAKESLLLRKLEAAFRAGARTIEITDQDLARLPEDELPPLPDALRVTGRLAADSPDALAEGDFRFWLQTAYGPSGARLLGRFCHGDAEVHAWVERHLRAEEAMVPEAVFAEVVHLPSGRIGNVISRPQLRGYEIPFLGRSGAPADRQIAIDDLDVVVTGEQIVLRSRRLGKEVIPRLTNAHNFEHGSLAVYRFLGALQTYGLQPGLYWSWGVFDELDFLPRVTSGRLVLARARWLARAEDVRALDQPTAAGRFTAFQAWRAARGLPRHLVLRQEDNELWVDGDNSLSIDAFLSAARNLPVVELVEMFPAPDALCVEGPEGRFVHDLVVPFRRRAAPREARNVGRPAGPVSRSFAPGSEWLYAKIYSGAQSADRVLSDAIRPVVEQAVAEGVVDRWFFLRYTDPEHHVRVRFHGRPDALHDALVPRLQAALACLRAEGVAWRVQLDTYEREIERYGGAAGIGLAERVAWVDSEAVLALLGLFAEAGEAAGDVRWRLALLGAARYFDDFTVSSDTRLEQMDRIGRSFGREFHVDKHVRKQLAARLRRERRGLEALLRGDTGGDPLLGAGGRILAERSARLRPIVAAYRSREAEAKLTLPVDYVNLSFVHMFVNRLIRTDARAHEMVLYDFLLQLERSRAARARKRAESTLRSAVVTAEVG